MKYISIFFLFFQSQAATLLLADDSTNAIQHYPTIGRLIALIDSADEPTTITNNDYTVFLPYIEPPNTNHFWSTQCPNCGRTNLMQANKESCIGGHSDKHTIITDYTLEFICSGCKTNYTGEGEIAQLPRVKATLQKHPSLYSVMTNQPTLHKP